MPNHTYRRHVPPQLADRVDAAFGAMGRSGNGRSGATKEVEAPRRDLTAD